jgi:acyl dehydratase
MRVLLKYYYYSLWHSQFYTSDRIHTSTPFAKTLDLRSRLLPFAYMLFHAVSMSHVDMSTDVWVLGFSNAVYVSPCFAGDTFRKTFTVKNIRGTNDSKHTLVTLTSRIVNQRGQLCFQVDKRLLYQGTVGQDQFVRQPSAEEIKARGPPKPLPQHLLSHIKYNAAALPRADVSLARVRRKQLISHAFTRAIGKTGNVSLSTLFRWAHPMIYNKMRYAGENELIMSGGLALAATTAAASRELHETLHETLVHANFLNPVGPTDCISAISYIHDINTVRGGTTELEELDVTTIAVKNIDTHTACNEKQLPLALFKEALRPKDLRAITDMGEAGFTHDHVVLQTRRKVTA